MIGNASAPHIAVPDGLPGMAGLMAYKPSLGSRIQAFAQELLRGPSPLSPGERELIAAFVSSRNECYFCAHLHTGVAAYLLDSDRDAVCTVIADVDTAPVSDKLRALLTIAAKVANSGRDVTSADIAGARAAGAEDEDIHDAVLVAAAFCMFNRYVDGLRAITPRDDAVYDRIGRVRADDGYLSSPTRR
ncbi:peroxidase-related enzyme [Kribbella sp. NBC_01245]|uniref:carboxymuconolactone decarboxylase family protein n=1 Tax=Kribbella sp. NBC_01245 TaxID=2903578 RepID=UPI002E2B115B|nr:peroxidase-related enzyme [Kribbella sp. NBC_01245]